MKHKNFQPSFDFSPLVAAVCVFVAVLTSSLGISYVENFFLNLPSAPIPLVASPALSRNAWQPPIGIPEPEFGIAEVAPEYDPNNSLHYYVNGPTNCSDNNNAGRGSPTTPRCTIPDNLSPGSVVAVSGGPYAYSQGLTNWLGTAEQPVFIRGVSDTKPRFNTALPIYHDRGGGGQYVILENLDLYRLEISDGYHHVALRNSNVSGDLTSGGVAIGTYDDNIINDITIWNNNIGYNGDWNQWAGDQDVHGVAVNRRAHHVWILDNEIHHNSGDGIQIEGSLSNGHVHNIYVGRNRTHHNKQTGFWVKKATDVIFSQNQSFDHRPSESSRDGACAGYQYGPERVWFIYNDLHDCDTGLLGASANDGTGQNVYIVGNKIYRIHGTTAPNPAAILNWAGRSRYAVNNTIYDVDRGIYSWDTNGSWYVVNNIIPNWQVASQLQTQNNLTSGALFVDVANADFRQRLGSPAIDGGTESSVYQTFYNTYGLDIKKDFDNLVRPQGTNWDIGAYEFNPSSGDEPPVDTMPPAVTITNPADGATVSGTLDLTASASDNVGVALIEWYLDGVKLSSNIWNTTGTTNGPHTLTVTVYDAAENQTSASVSVDVNNQTSSALVISSWSVSGVTKSAATVRWTTNLPSSAVIRYGVNRSNLNGLVTSSTFGTNHNVYLTGLSRNTRYYYEIVATAGTATAKSTLGQFKTKNR